MGLGCGLIYSTWSVNVRTYGQNACKKVFLLQPLTTVSDNFFSIIFERLNTNSSVRLNCFSHGVFVDILGKQVRIIGRYAGIIDRTMSI